MVTTSPAYRALIADAQRKYMAVSMGLEAESRAELERRVRVVIAQVLYGEEAWTDDVGASAKLAVDVFIEFLRNPPVREVKPDGTETVHWP